MVSLVSSPKRPAKRARSKKRLKCRCCGKKRARPDRRGLCNGCSRLPDSLEKYPSLHKSGRRGLGDHNAPKRPKEPTVTMPGTLDRMRVYQARVLRGEGLFHDDDDNRYSCADRPFEGLPFWSPGQPTGLE